MTGGPKGARPTARSRRCGYPTSPARSSRPLTRGPSVAAPTPKGNLVQRGFRAWADGLAVGRRRRRHLALGARRNQASQRTALPADLAPSGAEHRLRDPAPQALSSRGPFPPAPADATCSVPGCSPMPPGKSASIIGLSRRAVAGETAGPTSARTSNWGPSGSKSLARFALADDWTAAVAVHPIDHARGGQLWVDDVRLVAGDDVNA